MNTEKNSKKSSPAGLQEGWPAREALDNFIRVVSGVIPLLDSVKESLEETTGSIPKASLQLDNVSKATESAAVEILDLLEKVSVRVDSLGKALDVFRAAAGGGEARLCAIDALISSLKVSHPDVYARWNEFRTAGGGGALPADLDAQFSALRADVMNIGMALQVQDITTQQIAGVSHMIESIRKHLAGVLQSLHDGKKFVIPASPKAEGVDPGGHFNAEAEYSRAPDLQESADEIVERWKRGNNV